MFIDIFFILIGFVILVKGADYFVTGSVALGDRFKVSHMVMGITVVALGTSLPELFVNIATYERSLDSALVGNIIGSNLFNLGVVLGLYATIMPVTGISQNTIRFDIPYAQLMTVVFGAFALTNMLPGFREVNVDRNFINLSEGLIIGVLYTFFIYRSYQYMKKRGVPPSALKEIEEKIHPQNESTAMDDTDESAKKSLRLEGLLERYYPVAIVIGIAGLYIGSELTVTYAVSLAKKLGLSDAFIGVFILAVGTSLPELITTLVAVKKQYSDIALGNIIGSTICNFGLLLPVFSVLRPILYTENFNLPLAVLFFMSAYLIFILRFRKQKVINRFDGMVLLGSYMANSIYFYLEYSR